MALTHDVDSDFGSNFFGDASWSHPAAGAGVKGVEVYIVCIPGSGSGEADEIAGVTYGGVAMTQCPSSPFVNNAGTETSVIHAFHLGSAIPQGTQTVAIDTSAALMPKFAWCETVLGSADTVIEDDNTAQSAPADTDATVDLVTGGAVNTFVTAACFSGVSAPSSMTALTGYTKEDEFDYGAQSCVFIRKNAVATGGTFAVGVAIAGPAEEWGIFAVAIKEAGGITQSVGQVVETDVSNATSKAKKRVLGQSTQDQTAQAVTALHGKFVAQSLETDVSQVLSKKKSKVVGQAVEGDSSTIMDILLGPSGPQPNILAQADTRVNDFELDLLIGADQVGAIACPYYISSQDINDAPFIVDVRNDGAGGGVITGWHEGRHSNPLGPRTCGILFIDGDLRAGDTITIEWDYLFIEVFIDIIDWFPVLTSKPFGPVIHEGSIANANTDLHPLHRLNHPDNALCVMKFTGGGTNAISHDEGLSLHEVHPNDGVAAVRLIWKHGQFVDHDVLFSWSGVWSNLALAFEVNGPDADGGASVNEMRTLKRTTGASGAIRTTETFHPGAGKIVHCAALTNRVASSADLVSVIFDAGAQSLAFSKKNAINVDADRRLHHWICRMPATDPGTHALQLTMPQAQTGWNVVVWEEDGPVGVGNLDSTGDTFAKAVPASATVACNFESESGLLIGSRSGSIVIIGTEGPTVTHDLEAGWIPVNGSVNGDSPHDTGLVAPNGNTLIVARLFSDDDKTISDVLSSARDSALIWTEVLGIAGQNIGAGEASEADIANPVTFVKRMSISQPFELNISGGTKLLKGGNVHQVISPQTSQPITRAKKKPIAQVVSSHLANPLLSGAAHIISQAISSHIAQILKKTRSRVIAQALNVQTAQSLIHGFQGQIGTSIEFEEVKPVKALKSKAIGQAVQTNIAQQIKRMKVELVALATETDLSRIVSRGGFSATLVQAVETDLSQGVAESKRKSVGQATEGETGQSVSKGKAESVSQAVETDLGTTVLSKDSRTLGQAVESQVVQAIAKRKVTIVALAMEQEQAIHLGSGMSFALGRATEGELAQAIQEVKARFLGQVSESDFSNSIAELKVKQLGQAFEVDLSESLSKQKMKIVGQVTEGEISRTVTKSEGFGIGQAVESESASHLFLPFFVVVGRAVEIEVAFEIARGVFGPAEALIVFATPEALLIGVDSVPRAMRDGVVDMSLLYGVVGMTMDWNMILRDPETKQPISLAGGAVVEMTAKQEYQDPDADWVFKVTSNDTIEITDDVGGLAHIKIPVAKTIGLENERHRLVYDVQVVRGIDRFPVDQGYLILSPRVDI